VTLAALASGLGVVAFKEGAAAQHARDGVNARLAPSGDEAAFIDAALSIAASRKLLQRLRLNAPSAVAALGWPVILSNFERHLAAAADLNRLYADALAAS
jgi:glycosyltransferase involved in cell wall biosynthesis